jgi:hypothetical protein
VIAEIEIGEKKIALELDSRLDQATLYEMLMAFSKVSTAMGYNTLISKDEDQPVIVALAWE